MKTISLDSKDHLNTTSRPGILDGTARSMLLKRLSRLQNGQLVINENGHQHVFGQIAPGETLKAFITVRSPAFYGDIAFGGSIGAGEAWMQGYWDCDDLVSLVRIMLRNRDILDEMEGGLARFTRPLQKLFHRVNRNTRRGAQRNISAHYDLGNEFFSEWLDESMMYSCAIFEEPGMSLAEAQEIRLQRVCERLELEANDHLVEIGTGWGSMAIYAARTTGCRVTTTTISSEQYNLACERIRAAGLQDRITVLLSDYRDLKGQFDKLVSLEMIEAIGASQFDTYFAKCSSLLKPGGRMLIQAITIEDEQFEQYKRNVDFIQRYIFPGSCLPSVGAMQGAIGKTGELEVTNVHDIGLHYAITLNHWRRNFFDRIERIRELGYPETFIRMWEYYFCYCEGGFLERSISDVHLVAKKT